MALSVVLVLKVGAQDHYQYNVDLTNCTDDQLTVELVTPVIKKKQINFYLPKIVPGTYMNSNYGKYVKRLEAYDKAGKPLIVVKAGDNGWTIRNAAKLYRLKYVVEDTWDATIDNKVYPMCGTSFEAGKNFVLNTPGIFGYFEEMKEMDFQLSFTKPAGFFAATGLIADSSTSGTDVFRCRNADHLYDSPIVFVTRYGNCKSWKNGCVNCCVLTSKEGDRKIHCTKPRNFPLRRKGLPGR